jgi:DNA-binding transcriptional LysR family regulator
MPTPYAHYRVLPLLPEFRALYPEVKVEFHISNRNVDFGDEGFDLAIRGRMRRRFDHDRRASWKTRNWWWWPRPLPEAAGTPRTPDALRAHNCIQFALPSTGKQHSLAVPQTAREDIEVPTGGGLYGCAEDILGAVTLARAAAAVPDLPLHRRGGPEIRAPGGSDAGAWRARRGPSACCIRMARHVAVRVRAFVDFLVEKLPGRSR